MRFLVVAGIFGLALLISGCASAPAQLTTFQDVNHPVSRQSKLAFPATTPDDVSSRVATAYLQQEMQEMGFNLVPIDQADFSVRCTLENKNTVVGTGSGASVGTGIGGGSSTGGGGAVFSGIGLSIPLGEPRTVTQRTTQMAVTIETTAEPKLPVWQGNISAKADDEADYHEQFYRALLLRVGENFNQEINLAKVPMKDTKP